MNKINFYIKSLLKGVRIISDLTSPPTPLHKRGKLLKFLSCEEEFRQLSHGEFFTKSAFIRTRLLKYSPLGLGAFLGLWALHFQVVGQKWYAPTQKEVSSGIYVSTSGQNPFWLRTNQYGIVPLESQFATFRGGVYKDYRNNSPKRQKSNNTNAVPLSLSKGNSSNDIGLREAETRLSQLDNDAVSLLPVGRQGSLSKGNSSNDEGLRQAQTDIRQAGTHLSQTDTNVVTLSLSKGKGDNKNGLRQTGTRLFQTDRKLDFGYGFSAVANVGKVNQVLLPEAYLKVKYGAFEIYGGRRKEIVGLVDTTLTSGSYIWSGNALPMPKVQISIPNYTSIIGKGLISIKGAFAHGWFDNGLVKNFYLHQKWLYGKLGKDNWKVNFYAGFNHQVQWGGKPATPYIESSTGRLITRYPTGWRTYLQVVTGVSLNRNGDGLEQEGIPLNEALNRAGNHLGSVDIGGELKVESGRILLYRQSIYEDGSLFYLNNITDGLLGISYKHLKQKNSAILKLYSIGFEYLNTTSQGGSGGSGSTIPELRGQDNYFNNSIYRNGWTYNGSTIGSPFLLPLNAINTDVSSKVYSSTLPLSYLVNNRVESKIVTLHSSYKKVVFFTKMSYTNNLGMYSNAINLKSLSLLQSFCFPYKSYSIHTQFAYDSTKLFGKPQAGISIRLSKYW